MKNYLFRILALLLLGICGPALLYAATEHAVSIEKLKVEYAEMPLGIDVEKPRFSWQMVMQNAERGYSQKAYQITVLTKLDKRYGTAEECRVTCR